MTDQEILYKSFKKAEAGGYKNDNFNHPMCREQSDNIIKYYWIRAFIFDPEFAKTIWGETEVDDMGRDLDTAWEELWKNEGQHSDKDDFENDFGFDIPTKIAWNYHLEKMVIMKEPLKYLEKFL